MFKQFFTMLRGASHEVAQGAVDANIMVLLRQQIRDATAAIENARHALAVASAQNEQELRQHQTFVTKMRDLEMRTVEAINQGKDDLAEQGAESIAMLEDEIKASKDAQELFVSEIVLMKERVRDAENRLRELQRGQRLAEAAEQTRKLHAHVPGSGASGLQEAEATLERLRKRQAESLATANAMIDLKNETDPANVSRRLAEAGCGKPVKSRADDVLARLTKKSGKAA